MRDNVGMTIASFMKSMLLHVVMQNQRKLSRALTGLRIWLSDAADWGVMAIHKSKAAVCAEMQKGLSKYISRTEQSLLWSAAHTRLDVNPT